MRLGWQLAVLAGGLFGIAAGTEVLESGPQPGTALNQVNVTKIAGPDDGALNGTTLCYR